MKMWASTGGWPVRENADGGHRLQRKARVADISETAVGQLAAISSAILYGASDAVARLMPASTQLQNLVRHRRAVAEGDDLVALRLNAGARLEGAEERVRPVGLYRREPAHTRIGMSTYSASLAPSSSISVGEPGSAKRNSALAVSSWLATSSR